MITVDAPTHDLTDARAAFEAEQGDYQALGQRIAALQADIETLQDDADGQEAKRTALIRLELDEGQDVAKERKTVDRKLEEIAATIEGKRQNAAYLESRLPDVGARLVAAEQVFRAAELAEYRQLDCALVIAAQVAFRAAETAWSDFVQHRAVEGPRVGGHNLFFGDALQDQAAGRRGFSGLVLELPFLIDIHGNMRV